MKEHEALLRALWRRADDGDFDFLAAFLAWVVLGAWYACFLLVQLALVFVRFSLIIMTLVRLAHANR